MAEEIKNVIVTTDRTFPEVVQLETADPVLGGTYDPNAVDSKAGMSNRMAYQITGRTNFLAGHIQQINTDLGTASDMAPVDNDIAGINLSNRLKAIDAGLNSILQSLKEAGILIKEVDYGSGNVIPATLKRFITPTYEYVGQNIDLKPKFDTSISDPESDAGKIVKLVPSVIPVDGALGTPTYGAALANGTDVAVGMVKYGDKTGGAVLFDGLIKMERSWFAITDSDDQTKVAIPPQTPEGESTAGTYPQEINTVGRIIYLQNNAGIDGAGLGRLTWEGTGVVVGECFGNELLKLEISPLELSQADVISGEDVNYQTILSVSGYANTYYETFTDPTGWYNDSINTLWRNPSDVRPTYVLEKSSILGKPASADNKVNRTSFIFEVDNTASNNTTSPEHIFMYYFKAQKTDNPAVTTGLVSLSYKAMSSTTSSYPGGTADSDWTTINTDTMELFNNNGQVYVPTGFVKLLFKISWIHEANLNSYGIFVNAEPQYSGTALSFESKVKFTSGISLTATPEIRIPANGSIATYVSSPTYNGHTYIQDGRTLIVRMSDGRVLTEGIHYNETSTQSITLIAGSLKAVVPANEYMIYSSYGGFIDVSTTNAAIVKSLVDSSGALIIPKLSGIPNSPTTPLTRTGERHLLYINEDNNVVAPKQ